MAITLNRSFFTALTWAAALAVSGVAWAHAPSTSAGTGASLQVQRAWGVQG